MTQLIGGVHETMAMPVSSGHQRCCRVNFEDAQRQTNGSRRVGGSGEEQQGAPLLSPMLLSQLWGGGGGACAVPAQALT